MAGAQAQIQKHSIALEECFTDLSMPRVQMSVFWLETKIWLMSVYSLVASNVRA